MINDDGTTAPKWSVSDTTSVAMSNNVEFEHFNQYDWCYVMNMMYSDYREVLGDSLSMYVKMSKKFLFDKDAPKGKALRYYLAMRKEEVYY